MADWLRCLKCKTIVARVEPATDEKCPACGRVREVLSHERVREGMEAGVYFNIDPVTGERLKKPR